MCLDAHISISAGYFWVPANPSTKEPSHTVILLSLWHWGLQAALSIPVFLHSKLSLLAGSGGDRVTSTGCKEVIFWHLGRVVSLEDPRRTPQCSPRLCYVPHVVSHLGDSAGCCSWGCPQSVFWQSCSAKRCEGSPKGWLPGTEPGWRPGSLHILPESGKDFLTN